MSAENILLNESFIGPINVLIEYTENPVADDFVAKHCESLLFISVPYIRSPYPLIIIC